MNNNLELYSQLRDNNIGHFVPEHIPFLLSILEEVNPKVIWEFGFNVGHSSSLWLALTEAQVHSTDPANGDIIIKASEHIKELYPNRFYFYNCSSQSPFIAKTMLETKADFLLIDGDHSYDGCWNDLNTAKKMDINHIIIDNLEDTSNVGRALDQFLLENIEYKLVSQVTISTIITGYVRKK